MRGPVGLAHLTAGYEFLDPNPVSFDSASWIPVSTPVLEEKTYAGNVTRQRENVHHMFFPDQLQIINEKISTSKKVVLFELPPGICLKDMYKQQK